MNRHQLEQLLPALGIKKWSNPGDWLQASCPFAPFKHDGGSDRHPSWGITVNSQGPSHHSCFSCKSFGDMHELVFELRHLYKSHDRPFSGDWKRAFEIAMDDNEEQVPDFEEIDVVADDRTIPFPET